MVEPLKLSCSSGDGGYLVVRGDLIVWVSVGRSDLTENEVALIPDQVRQLHDYLSHVLGDSTPSDPRADYEEARDG